MIIGSLLLDKVSAEAKVSPRLRVNYNFHHSLDELYHRFLNAVELGTIVPIHRHPTKDETFVILRGKVRVTTHNDDGIVIDDVVLCQENGNYGVDIPKGVWHKLESLAENSVIFECKLGPFVPHEEEGILQMPETTRSCSMDFGGITPKYIYRMLGGQYSIDEIQDVLSVCLKDFYELERTC